MRGSPAPAPLPEMRSPILPWGRKILSCLHLDLHSALARSNQRELGQKGPALQGHPAVGLWRLPARRALGFSACPAPPPLRRPPLSWRQACSFSTIPRPQTSRQGRGPGRAGAQKGWQPCKKRAEPGTLSSEAAESQNLQESRREGMRSMPTEGPGSLPF